MKKLSKKVSVIIAAYNAERYILRSLQSVLSQTYKDYEIIVIDDASTDNTAAIVRDFQNSHSNITLISNKNNIGQTKSRNLAIEIAQGEYIAILDADDECINTRLEKQVAFLDRRKDIYLVGGGALEVDSDTGSVKSYYRISNPVLLSMRLAKKNCIYHPSIMFRNDGAKYREKFRYAEDYDFYLCALTQGKRISSIKDIVVKYTLSNTQIRSTKRNVETNFANHAKRFFSERKKNGYDSYILFDESLLLSQ